MSLRPRAAPWLIGMALAWPLPAGAQPAADWYVSFGLGWDYAENVTLSATRETLGFDLGAPVASAAVGRALAGGWRAELELAHRSTDPEVLYQSDSGAETEVDPRDRFTASSLTVNLLRDFEVGRALRPYLGLGAGLARLNLEVSEVEIDGLFLKRPRRMIVDDRSSTPVVQLVAGFTAPLTRHLDLGLDYRYWHAWSADLDDTAGRALDLDHAVHSTWLHLRYAFAERVRAPEPAAAARGLYLAARLGGGFAADANIDNSFDNFDAFDIGPVATLAVGYAPSRSWRFELEVAQRSNHPEVVDFSPEVGQFRARGKVQARSLMTNALYRWVPGAAIRPYAGAGVGRAWVDYEVRSRGVPFVVDDDSALAAQGILGLEVALTRRVTFAAEYRFWVTDDLSMTQPDGTPVITNHQVHGVLLGLSRTLAGRRR